MTPTHLSSITHAHRNYIKRGAIVGVMINCVFSIAFTMLFVPKTPSINLWGETGIAMDLVPTVFMLTLMGNLAITLITAKRLRGGMISAIPDRTCGWPERRLPANPLLRVIVVAIVMSIILVPLSILLLWFFGIQSMLYREYLLFKAVYGPIVGVLSVGVVIRSALMQRDDPFARV
jgi:hypothetical protein